MTTDLEHSDYVDVRALPAVPKNTPEQKRAARLAVAARSTSVEDCRELLAMLGLLEVVDAP